LQDYCRGHLQIAFFFVAFLIFLIFNFCSGEGDKLERQEEGSFLGCGFVPILEH
jgi:hypothetical protein